MFERVNLEDARYIDYSELLDHLHEQFPAVPRHRIESIIVAENDAITGGFLRIVPAEVATGAVEMLEREPMAASEDGEVA
ncbi:MULTISPECIES: hypothetical protein [unclassified Microbacterium]|uniref:hypothetical protein n=1 Tax=unclassified Microbacterium TaxID=2609290 RepID=UPI0016050E84|nr:MULTISPECIES: hypothetical protein [unclassified Microbacterium]QNA91437.1 hypothetical protein G4G29_01495 [Microbacterium sp. Se63.02b]QYM64607.1 hypothetical protein K1X59_01505 [Microbacterium sp. Se5.02b]